MYHYRDNILVIPPSPNVQLGKEKKHLGCVCVRSCPTAGQYWVWSVSYPRHAGNYADFSASFTQWPAAPHSPFSLSLSLSLSISPHCLILIHTQHTPPDELWRSAVCVWVDGSKRERERERERMKEKSRDSLPKIDAIQEREELCLTLKGERSCRFNEDTLS